MISEVNLAHSFPKPSSSLCGPYSKTYHLSMEHHLYASPAQALREMSEPGFEGSVAEGPALTRAQEEGDREFWLFLS